MARGYEFYVRAEQYCFYHENINIQIFEPIYTDKNYRGEKNCSSVAGIYCISLLSLVYFLQILLEYRNDRFHSLSSFKSTKFLFFFFFFILALSAFLCSSVNDFMSTTVNLRHGVNVELTVAVEPISIGNRTTSSTIRD